MESYQICKSGTLFSEKIIAVHQPRTVRLKKDAYGFGFTLRHFIVYPPANVTAQNLAAEENESTSIQLAEWKPDGRNRPMDTIFIREVKQGSSAHKAGLVEGDRIIAINNHPLMGKSYSDIINLILESGITLLLLVVPKEDDILQLYFASSAYQPVSREQNQHYDDEMNHLTPCEGRRKYLVKKCSEDYCFPFHQSVINEIKPYKVEKCFTKSEESEQNIQTGVSSDADLQILEQRSKTKPNLQDTFSHIFNGTCHSGTSALLPVTSDFNHALKKSCLSNMSDCSHWVDHEQDVGCASEFVHETENIVQKPDFNFEYLKFNNDCDSNCACISLENWDSSTSGPMTELSQKTSPQILQSLDSSDFGHYTDYLMNSKTSQSQISEECDYNMHTKDLNEINSDDSTFDASSINIVAQRCHQFESGNLLAESLEKMKLYKSELSRMSQPKQTQIVSVRAAHFENISTPLQCVPESLSQDSCIQANALNGQNVLYEKTQACADENVSRLICTTDSSDLSKMNEHELKSFSHNSKINTSESSIELLDMPESTAVSSNCNQDDPVQTEVVYRRKPVPEHVECHLTRRISYLRATAEDRMLGDAERSDDEESMYPTSQNGDHRIQKLKSFFGEKTPRVKQGLHQPAFLPDDCTSCVIASEVSNSVYGWLICKVVSLEGKRSSDRSWRHVWAILRDDILYLLRERREPSNGSLTSDDHVINVKNSITTIADDYLKRKNVLRLMLLNGTEYLVQAENRTSMMEWLRALQIFSAEMSKMPNWTRDSSVLQKAIAYEQQIQINKAMSVLHQSHHPVRKLVFRHRSPSEHVLKARRASQGDEMALSKIGVMWRDRVMQGWKKVHGTVVQDLSRNASFGVRLEYAPSAVSNENVPLLVELCVQIVENHGLDMVGIYRVPGNNAAVSMLTHTIDQGLDDVALQDTRWNDVNVVSSLLKAFFRKLPEPLLTSHLYSKFIMASKIEDPLKRLTTIKNRLQQLPVHHFETLKYLMCHLKKVVEHSNMNKMEARNLAIVFGPTLVRAVDNSMIAMVTDMSHQCYLIETMITYADWLFQDTEDTVPYGMNLKDKRKTHPAPTTQSSTLINNIYKFDNSHEEFLKDILPHEMLSSLQNSACHHLRHRTKNKHRSSKVKRSGIIEQSVDCDLLDFQLENKDASLMNSDQTSPRLNLSKIDTFSDSIDSCNSLTYGSVKSKPNESRSMSPKNTPILKSSPHHNNHSCMSQDAFLSSGNAGDEIVVHTYDELSALAQQKVRNFEKETKALLKRDISKTQAPVKSGHVGWEQIEREWQKAKLELEEEDLLDHLADDPSFLSLLLNRRADICSEDDFCAKCDSSQNIYLMDFENSNIKPRTFSECSATKVIESSDSPIIAKAESQHVQLLEKEQTLMTPSEGCATCKINTLVKYTNVKEHSDLSSATHSFPTDVSLSDTRWTFLEKECKKNALSGNCSTPSTNILPTVSRTGAYSDSQRMQFTPRCSESDSVSTTVSETPVLDKTRTFEMSDTTDHETLDTSVLNQRYGFNNESPAHIDFSLGSS